MTTQKQTNEYAFQVGDQVILTKDYGSEPIITTVTRTTKTTFQIEGSDLKYVMPTDYFSRKNGSPVRGSKYGNTTVYAYSANELAELQTDHDMEETHKAEKSGGGSP